MTFSYYASFVPGLEESVAEIVRERLGDVIISRLLEGAIIFETACTYDRLNFFCFHNIFVLGDLADLGPGRSVPADSVQALEYHMKKVCHGPPSPALGGNNSRIRSFRIVTAVENRPAAVDERIRRETEKYIARYSGLKPDRSGPDTEFWFLLRREGSRRKSPEAGEANFVVFMKRLTKHPAFEKVLCPGELHPQLAYMLCALGRPRAGETALDPFCGFGSIPREGLRRFPLAEFHASDLDEKALDLAGKKFMGPSAKRCRFQKSDFRDLPSLLGRERIDLIVTDPPWGHFGGKRPGGMENFYTEMAGVFSELLKNGGRAVILCGETEALMAGMEKGKTLRVIKTIPVLVSGHKASVVLAEKGPQGTHGE